jgi:GNAT superfamily N-acetyltransferase
MVRVAEERDAEAACHVLRRSITECCSEDHGNDPSRLVPWLSNKTPENLRQWISSANNYAVVAEAGCDIVGVAMMRNSGEITLCYLLPEVRFTGVGRALLAALESKGRELGLREVRLESTKTARQFYLRNGFTPSGASSSCKDIECFPMIKSLAPL